MRRILLCSLSLLLVGGVWISCAPKYQFGDLPKDAPDWVKNPPFYEDAYACIGISAPRLSISMARTQAETRGRAGLGRVLETRISQMAKDFMEAATEGNVENLQVSEQQFTRTVSRSVSKQTIVGAQVNGYWTNPQNGETYALIVLKKSDALPIAKDRTLGEARKNRLYGEYRTNQALEEMERIIEKEYEASVPAEQIRGE